MKGILKSFRWAWQGFCRCLRTERNLRIHLTAAALAVWLSGWYDLSRGEQALLWLTIGAVIAAEVFNSAIEGLVDLVCPHRDPRAGSIKDAAAAGVLILAVAALGVGIALFWQPAVLRSIWANPRQLIIPLAIVVIGIWAVFILPYEEKS
jgi:diacylglycerol kinase